MPMDAFEEDIARPFGVAARGGGGAAKIASYGPGNYVFTAPITGLFAFLVSGASGAGLALAGSGGPTGGGGGHGYTEKVEKLQKGDSVPITVPSGGRYINNANGNFVSVVGGTATVQLPSTTLSVSPGSNSLDQNGGSGGSGAGGTLNLSGGAGGRGSATGAFAGTPGEGPAGGAGGVGVLGGSYGAGGGGGGAGTVAQPGAQGGAGTVSLTTSQAARGAGGGVGANVGGTVGSFGGDGRVSVYWLG